MDFYAYQHPLGRIDDIAELRNEFIAIYDTKSKKEIVDFCMRYDQHILELTGFIPCDEIVQLFEAMQEWLDGKTNYHKARNLCGEIYTLARNEQDPTQERFLRTIAQIGCSPHVKFHGLWATDFGITLINRLYPQNMCEVMKEREKQIELVNRV